MVSNYCKGVGVFLAVETVTWRDRHRRIGFTAPETLKIGRVIQLANY